MVRNRFTTFNMEKKYDISLKELKQRYREQVLIYHPDNTLEISDNEKISSIREDYAILNDPLKRAQHILEIENLISPNNYEASINNDLQLNTEIFELYQKFNLINDINQQQIFRNDIVNDNQKLYKRMEEYFRHSDYINAFHIWSRILFLERFLSRIYEQIRKNLLNSQ